MSSSQQLVPRIVIFVVFNRLFPFHIALGFGVGSGSSLQLRPTGEYASQSMSWHDIEGKESILGQDPPYGGRHVIFPYHICHISRLVLT